MRAQLRPQNNLRNRYNDFVARNNRVGRFLGERDASMTSALPPLPTEVPGERTPRQDEMQQEPEIYQVWRKPLRSRRDSALGGNKYNPQGGGCPSISPTGRRANRIGSMTRGPSTLCRPRVSATRTSASGQSIRVECEARGLALEPNQ